MLFPLPRSRTTFVVISISDHVTADTVTGRRATNDHTFVLNPFDDSAVRPTRPEHRVRVLCTISRRTSGAGGTLPTLPWT